MSPENLTISNKPSQFQTSLVPVY